MTNAPSNTELLKLLTKRASLLYEMYAIGCEKAVIFGMILSRRFILFIDPAQADRSSNRDVMKQTSYRTHTSRLRIPL
jgi:hypothetical protein